MIEKPTIVYHGSPTPRLTVLEPRQTAYFGKPWQVCLTRLLPMALLYGKKHFEYTYGYDKNGQLYYEEYFPGALEAIYRGHAASLYLCDERDDMTTTQIPYELVTAEPVPIREERPVPDIYDALLAQEAAGAIVIIRWPDMTEKRRAWVMHTERDIILTRGLLAQNSPYACYMRARYPASWTLAEQKAKSIPQTGYTEK